MRIKCRCVESTGSLANDACDFSTDFSFWEASPGFYSMHPTGVIVSVDDMKQMANVILAKLAQHPYVEEENSDGHRAYDQAQIEADEF